MRTEEFLHSPAITRVMLRFAQEQGVDAQTCLVGTQLQPEMLLDSDRLITRAQEMQVMENLISALQDVPALGFQMGLQYTISAFGVWGFVLTTCKNIREAVELAIRYLPLSTAYCRITVMADQNELGIVFDATEIPATLRTFLLHRDIATGLNIAREAMLDANPALRLELQGAPPTDAGQIERLSPVSVSWRQEFNRVVLDMADAYRPMPTYNERFVRQLEEQCRALMKQRQVQGIGGQVRNVLLGKTGFLKNTEEVAKELGISPRSLRRRLETEGTSFRELLEDARQQVAEHLLLTTKMTLEELAFHLGYSDAATFTRAFRRWHQQSPGEYRKSANRPQENP